MALMDDSSVAHGPIWSQEWVTIPPRPPIQEVELVLYVQKCLSLNPRGNFRTLNMVVSAGQQAAAPGGLVGAEGPALPAAVSAPTPQAGEAAPPAHAYVQLRPHGGTR